jgi:predicted metal-dependent hydrolase
MSEGDPIRHQLEGRTISYFFVRSRRARGYRITYLENATFKVSIPRGQRNPDPNELFARHRRWILNRLRDESKRRNIPSSLTDGGTLPLLGATLILKIQVPGEGKPACTFHPEEKILRLSARDSSGLNRALQMWYRQMAANFLRDRIPFWAKRMGVSPPAGIRVKNQRTIWGSCSHRRILNFNWRIMTLEPELAEYLIIHELAHLKHLNHSPRFWKTVARFCPQYSARRRDLRERNHWLLFGRDEPSP